MSKSVDDLKALLRSHGYKMSRWWRIETPLGTLTNTKLGGWPGLNMWLTWRESNGRVEYQIVSKMAPERLDRLYSELEGALC